MSSHEPEYLYLAFTTYAEAEQFVPPSWASWVDVIVVGGGAGGYRAGTGTIIPGCGGGGAGAVVSRQRFRVTPNVPVPVRAADETLATADSVQGDYSRFGAIFAYGGGQGQGASSPLGTENVHPAAGGGEGGGSGGGAAGGTTITALPRPGGAAGPGGTAGGAVLGAHSARHSGGGGGAKTSGGPGDPDAEYAGAGGDGYSLAELGWPYLGLPPPLNTVPFFNNSTAYPAGAWCRRTKSLGGGDTRTFYFQAMRPTQGEPPLAMMSGSNEPEAFNPLPSPWMLWMLGTGSGNNPTDPIVVNGGAVGGGGGGYGQGTGHGGPAGYGGGGDGASSSFNGGSGKPFTGGGGGGGGVGGSVGGSGVVLVRYLTQESWESQCAPVGVDQIVFDLARRAGLPAGRIDVSGIEPAEDYGRIAGFGIGRAASARTMIEILQRHSFFDVTEIGGIVAARRRDREPDGVIGGDDLRAHADGETPPTLASRERIEDYEIPAEVRVEYSQLDAEYEPGVEAYTRRVTDASGVLDVDLSSIAMEPDEAAVIAEATLLEAVVARESIETHLVATDANKALKPGDIKTLEVGDRQDVVRITDLGYSYPGIQRLKMLRHDPSVYSSDARGVGRGVPGSIVVQHGATTFELLDAPLVRELDDTPGYFAALGGIPTIPGVIEGWPGGDLSREEAAGPVDILRMLRPPCWFGVTTGALPADALYTIVDWRPVAVTTSGPLETVTLQEALQGRNLAAVEVRDGGERVGWELVRFLQADYDSEEGWSISGLIRGVNGTEWAIPLHQDGDRFVVLNNVGQVLADVDTELGDFREHNAATIGGAPDPATAVTFAWTGVDRVPWAPAQLTAERDGDSVFIRWRRRDRVGMELQNGQALPLSEETEAYVVTILNEAGTLVLRSENVASPEFEYELADELADFGSQQASLNIRVAQVGALGPGYAAGGVVQVTGDQATPPPLSGGDESRVVITVGGTFDADDTLYFRLTYAEAGVGTHQRLYTADGSGKSAVADYLTDLETQVLADFPGLATDIAGNELVISTTAGVLTGAVTNNTAVTTAALAQEAGGVTAGVTYVGTLDFYESDGGADVVGPSLSTKYGQGGSVTARLQVVGITYDAAKALGPSNLAQFNVLSNHDFGGAAVSYTAPMAPSVAAIDADPGFATYKNSVQLGTITGTPSPPPRAGVAITLAPNYRLAEQFWQTESYNVSASLQPLKFLVKTNRPAQPAFPSGAEQIVLVGFTSAGDQVETPQSVVEGQVYKIVLGATTFSRTVTAGDAADSRRESILQALADDIDADADFEVDLFTLNRPPEDPLAPGTFITQIEIRHVTPDTPFTFEAHASYGIEVSVVNEIVPE